MEFFSVLFVTLLVYTSTSTVVQGQLQSCTYGDVRLVGGSNDLEGNVEVCLYGEWGSVCREGWDRTDAGVVCRQLGYSYEGATTGYFFYFSFRRTYMSSVRCTGAESRLLNCEYSTDSFELYYLCDFYYAASARCQRGTQIDSIVEYNITDIDTDIEGIRLINGIEKTNMGRLELLYNGTWGTVCDDFWSYSDAKVACGMLGYDDAVCAITTNYFGRANYSVPIWMDNVQCAGSEEALDDCSFSGWGIHNCNHSTNDAGIVCANTSEIGIPYDIQLVESTTTALNISWMVPNLPDMVDSVRYYISYQSETMDSPIARTFTPGSSGGSNMKVTYALTSLTLGTQYTVQIRAQIKYSPCSTYVSGNYSDSVSYQTNATRKQSTIPIRLVSPYAGLDFLGRIEVFYNNQWGTICNDRFSTTDGNVVCKMLNFTRGAVCVSSSFAQGTGPIWLDNVDCRSHDEVIEDCDHNGWGNHNCRHSDDIGVICRKTLPPVMNLIATSTSPSSITLRWNRYTFPRGTSVSYYHLLYESDRIAPRTNSLSRSRTTYTLRNLDFGHTYNISVRAAIRYRYCYGFVYGESSNEVSITTTESAPGGPPTSFDVVVVNSTAIEALWGLPANSVRNGIIRGYKLFVQSRGRNIRNITIPNNQTVAYIVGGLERGTPYTLSILAYTVADGPRSIHLTAITLYHDPLIIGFGINGNGIDKVIKSSFFSYGIQVHCTVSNDPSITTTDWFFANGSKVGLVSSNFREGHYNNGTTVLQIGVGRRLIYCDGGNYTCVVNTTSSRMEKRSFHLLIGRSPPSPSRPSALEIKSTSIIIDWSQSACDGGHIPRFFNIRFRRLNSYSNTYTYATVADTPRDQRKYTVTGLSPSTVYEFSIQTTTFDGRTSFYSPTASFTTLPPAPSAPRDVEVRLVMPSLAEVSWRVPAISNGVITHYTVYAIPQISHEETRSKRQTPTLPKTIKKAFPSTSTAGNISLTEHSITYQFRVSASVNSGPTSNEGDLSPISPSATVFIPKPGLPVPANVRMINFTNTSITLSWEYPLPPIEVIENFLVTYFGEVEWRSPGDDLVQFEDSGEIYVADATVTISPLVPGTNYLIRVSAITQSGRGAEVPHYGTTKTSRDGKLAYFQLRMSPISNCLSFVDPSNNITDRLLKFRGAIIEELHTRVCPSCGLTIANIRDDEFSCHGGLTNHIVYRAMIIGTDTYSAPSLVSLIQSWVSSGSASVTVFSSRLRFDKDCTSFLDTLNEPDCPPNINSGQTTTTIKPKDDALPSALPHHVEAGEIGGFLIGCIIIVLLAVLIVAIVVIAVRKYKCKTFKRTAQHDRMFDASFSDIGSVKESIDFDTTDSNEN